MAKIKANKTTNTHKVSKPKGTIVYLLIAVLVLALIPVAMAVYKKIPQVSDSALLEISKEYYSNLKNLDTELDKQYAVFYEANDIEGWKVFSEAWVPKIGASKPEEFLKRLSKKSNKLVNGIEFLNRDLFQIWTVYNASMENQEPVNETEIKNLHDSIMNSKLDIESQLK